MMHEDDLRSLLTRRADDLPAPSALLGGVDRKVRNIRRNRVAGVAAALALIAGAAVAAPNALRNVSAPPATYDQTPPTLDGGVRVGRVVLPAGSTTAEVGFTPPTAALFYVVDCRTDRYPATADYILGVGGDDFSDVTNGCGYTGEGAFSGIDELSEKAAQHGIAAGRPTTATIRLKRPVDFDVVLAVYAKVPPAPASPGPVVARPTYNNPPDVSPYFSDITEIRPAASVNGTLVQQVTITGPAIGEIHCTAPGIVKVYVDDEATPTEYDCYGQQGSYGGVAFSATSGDADVRKKDRHTQTYTLRIVTTLFSSDDAWLVVVGAETYR